MNEKQITELIERMRELGHIYSYQGAKNLIREYEKLNKPEKVKVPQFVADWIEVCKEHLTTSLYTAMNPDFMKENNQSFDFILWIKKTSNQDLFALAWIFGYEVEEEKRYLVKIRATKHYIAKDGIGKIFFSLAYKEGFTKKQLEDLGFGWVFDCPGIEIEEVDG